MPRPDTDDPVAAADRGRMRQALGLAERGVGWTAPNPSVGAVIHDRRGRLIGSGWHKAAGCPHAEIEAMRSVRDPGRLRGATMTVTLEPCSTHGRTPPCTEAIIARGLGAVVIGQRDPNPAHRGRGVRALRAAGLDVRVGVLERECAAMNRGFAKWITTGRPWVIAKMAMSLDGRLTRPPDEERWLTGAEARRDAHVLRARADAILVGAGTVRADDPRLTVRLPTGHPGSGRKPLRVVLADTGRLPADAALFRGAARHRTVIYRGLGLTDVLSALGRRGVTTLLVEGGTSVFGSLFAFGLVDEVVAYIAPLMCGGGTRPVVDLVLPGGSQRITGIEVTRLGADTRIRGLVART